MTTPEGGVKRAIHDFLLWHGWLVIRCNQGARVTEDSYVRFAFWQALGTDEETAGIADLLAFKLGYPPLAIECKAGKNKPTEKQQHFLDFWQAHGGMYVVARRVEEVEAYMEGVVRFPYIN